MEEPAVTVGRIAKAHGVHGEVAVENRSDNPDRWVPGAVVFDEDGRSYTVRTVRPHGPRLLVTFDEVEDRTAAERLAGRTLQVPESWLPELPEGAIAVSGVFSDAFQTVASPQIAAKAAFHDQTATGKLKALITAMTPRGCHCSINRWLGRSD